MEPNQEQSLFDSNMDHVTQEHLQSVAKWTRFISITGFVMLGLVVILLLAAGSQLATAFSSLPGFGALDMAGAVIAILIIVLLIFGIWVFFLFKASNLLANGLQTRNSAMLAEGFSAMKTYFIISFVLSILSLLSTLYSSF